MNDSLVNQIQEIFKRHKIRSTEARLKLMDLILNDTEEVFSLNHIREHVKNKQLNISEAGIIVNLQLFVARGILKTTSDRIPRKKHTMGRPEAFFILNINQTKC